MVKKQETDAAAEAVETPARQVVRARVLAAGRIGDTECAVNDVIELAEADAAAMAAQGQVDTTPAAVAYADSLAAPSV